MRPEPYPLSPELRQQTLDALARQLVSDIPADVLKAVTLVLAMDRLNLEAERSRPWLPQPSNN